MSVSSQTITITLTADEYAIVEQLAQEQGLDNVEEALHSLIHDAEMLYDALWDKTFADTSDALEQWVAEVRAEHHAGLTEEFDPDNDGGFWIGTHGEYDKRLSR